MLDRVRQHSIDVRNYIIEEKDEFSIEESSKSHENHNSGNRDPLTPDNILMMHMDAANKNLMRIEQDIKINESKKKKEILDKLGADGEPLETPSFNNRYPFFFTPKAPICPAEESAWKIPEILKIPKHRGRIGFWSAPLEKSSWKN
jgi:hypothetical protein